MNELFPIEPSLSPRLRWIERHQVRTRETTDAERHMETDDLWLAWLEGDDFGGSGMTEDEAIVDLAKNLRIALWNEPSHPPKD